LQFSNIHSGGGCTKDAAGNLVPLRDQDSENSIVNSVIKSKELKVPVGLIIGEIWDGITIEMAYAEQIQETATHFLGESSRTDITSWRTSASRISGLKGSDKR
jgi:hypothetical protein